MADLLSATIAASKRVADPIAAAYASGNRPFTVEITRPGPPSTYDRDTHEVLNPDDPVIYRGPARIATISGGVELDVGDERTTMSSARITIDPTWTNDDEDLVDTTAPRVDDVVKVLATTQAQATHVVDRQFTVTDVEVGGHFGIGYAMSATGVSPSSRT